VFGSEIKSILKNPYVLKELKEEEILNYLKFRYVPAPSTFFRNVKKLLPGYCGEIDVNFNFTVEKYWEIPNQINVPHNFGEAVKMIEEELKAKEQGEEEQPEPQPAPPREREEPVEVTEVVDEEVQSDGESVRE
jgi:asparagine synthetase B (glutamine-hydrolysing)